jgi:hypothetical protein
MHEKVLHITRTNFPSYGRVETSIRILVDDSRSRAYVLARGDAPGLINVGNDVLGKGARVPAVNNFVKLSCHTLSKY